MPDLPSSTWPSIVIDLADFLRQLGGRALLVGGCVRDALWNLPVKDFDLEVYGLAPDQLESALARRFSLVVVGKSFGVLKLRDFPVDISLPRRERKTAPGHKGFAIEGDPWMSHEEAALRRDFTLNAIFCDPLTCEIIDPLNGLVDVRNRRLRHCSGQFAEDPLRVLRAMQFAARFEAEVDPQTIAFCRQLSLQELPLERIGEEWKKLLLRGRKPSLGLQFLLDCGWVRFFPELEALIGCEQHPAWHPEGDVWTHTGHCLDAFARERTGDDHEDFIVGLAVLCHDLGKPATTVRDAEGVWRSPEHEAAGAAPTLSFLARLTRETEIIESVLPLVTHHMRPNQLYDGRAGDAAIRRLARGVQRIDRLLRVVSADMQGRPPMPWDFAAIDWVRERASALSIQDEAPKPIILGRHLLAEGLRSGPHFRAILDACFEAQLEGKFHDESEGRQYLRECLARLGEKNGSD